jgi:predicted transcriptional regulator of viral defense system
MPRKSISSLILELLASERRAIVADWRIHIFYIRVAKEHSFRLPDFSMARKLIRQLVSSEIMKAISGLTGVYRLTIPFADTVAVTDEALIYEANPYSVLSYFSAMAYHGLTNVIPQDIYFTCFPKSISIPLGTSPDEWTDVRLPSKRKPKYIETTRSGEWTDNRLPSKRILKNQEKRQIHWINTKREWEFGLTIGYINGIPVYVTDVERTLLDALRFPGKCGGALEVFRAWHQAANDLKIDNIIDYIEKFNQTLLRQRVGFILETMGFSETIFDQWASKSVRGSSARLLADRDFSSQYSERWNLSLNVPESMLAELQES